MGRITALLTITAIALTAATPAGAAHNPTVITVTPNTHLTDAQSVTISWSGAPFGTGFRQAYQLDYQQCTLAYTPGEVDRDQMCNSGGGTRMLAADGSITYTVHTGPIGTAGGTCGTSPTDRKCLLVFFEQDRRHNSLMKPRTITIRFAA